MKGFLILFIPVGILVNVKWFRICTPCNLVRSFFAQLDRCSWRLLYNIIGIILNVDQVPSLSVIKRLPVSFPSLSFLPPVSAVPLPFYIVSVWASALTLWRPRSIEILSWRRCSEVLRRLRPLVVTATWASLRHGGRHISLGRILGSILRSVLRTIRCHWPCCASELLIGAVSIIRPLSGHPSLIRRWRGATSVCLGIIGFILPWPRSRVWPRKVVAATCWRTIHIARPRRAR